MRRSSFFAVAAVAALDLFSFFCFGSTNRNNTMQSVR
jgi:hypothetical protein